MAPSRKRKSAACAREAVYQCAANNANSLRHSDTNQKSSRTINKMLASSDVYIVAHKLTRDEGTKRFIDTVLTTDYFCPINLV